MTRDPTGDGTVLVIEDERHLADLYAEYLRDEYAVVTAYSGDEGLDRLTDDVDVVIVDRRMPVVSGNEVVAAIEDGDVDCRIAMVTTSVPEFDIIEFGVDDYLVKPVTRDDIVDVVERLLVVTEYTEALHALTRKKLTRNVLRVERSRTELAENDQYRELETEIGRLQSTVDSLATELELDERDLQL